MAFLLIKYNIALAKRPIFTKVMTAGVIMGAADILTQFLEQKLLTSNSSNEKKDTKMKLDWYRTARMASINGLLMAPVLHYYYIWIERAIPGSSTFHILKKLAFDQTVVAPANILVFLSTANMMENKGSIEQVKPKLQSDYLPTLKLNYLIWPIANFVNFKFVPIDLRILYISTVGLFWGAILARMTNKPLEQDEEK